MPKRDCLVAQDAGAVLDRDLGVEARDVGAGQAQVGFAAPSDREQRFVERDNPLPERVGDDQTAERTLQPCAAIIISSMDESSAAQLWASHDTSWRAASSLPLAAGPAARAEPALSGDRDQHLRSGPGWRRRRPSSGPWTRGSPTRGTLLDQLARRKGARTIDNTLRPFDDILLELDAVGDRRRS